MKGSSRLGRERKYPAGPGIQGLKDKGLPRVDKFQVWTSPTTVQPQVA